jgi:hypothetical protein
VTSSKDHRTGHAAIGEASGEAEEGRRGGHFLMVLMMVQLITEKSEL